MVQLTRQFALFKQTILNDTRSLGLQVLRFAFMLTLAIIFISVATQVNRWGRNLDGRYFFQAIFVINLFFVLTAAIFLFLPIVQEEKEENTLGMILMTGITPFAYLFGKVGSRFFILLLMMAVQIPLTLLCITMGGISMDSIFFAYFLLFCIAFFLGNLILFCSLIGTSIFSSLFIGTALTVGISITINSVMNFFHYISLAQPFGLFDSAVREVFSSNGSHFNEEFIIYFSILILVGVFFFFMSVLFFNVLTGDLKEINLPKKFRGIATSKQKAEQYIEKGLKKYVRKLKSKRFDKNPIIYKDYRFSSYGPHLYILQLLTFIGCGISFLIDELMWNPYRDISFDDIFYDMCRDAFPFFIFSMFTIVMLTSYLTFSQEIKSNTLNSLKTLPITASKLFRAKTLCVLRISAPSIFLFFTFFILYYYTDSVSRYNYTYYDPDRIFYESWLCLALVIPAYFLNAWLSMVLKKYTFFLANGLTIGVFIIQLMFFDMIRFQLNEAVWFLTFTGIMLSAFAYYKAIKIFKTY